MLSWGVEGLLDAYERYRPERQVSFKTYAAFRIRGMILDRLREEDHLPRRVRDISTRCEKTHTRLANLLQREPREDELASALAPIFAASSSAKQLMHGRLAGANGAARAHRSPRIL